MKKQITFLTSLFLAFSMYVSAADINVTAADDLQALIEAANDDDVFILADGDYNFTTPEGGDDYVDIAKSVTVKAANEGKAVLYKYQFRVNKVTIAGITFDGIVSSHDKAVDSKYFIQFVDGESVVENLTIKNCTISNYGRGVVRATVNKTARIDVISIENCVFAGNSCMGAGYAQINPQKSSVKKLTIKDCTFYDSKAALFRYSEAGAEPIEALVENCTILNCGSSEGRKMVELAADNVKSFDIKNCIFSGSNDATAPESKTIDLVNIGTIDNCLLEGFSSPLTAKVTPTNPVESTVTDFDFDLKKMTFTPAITGIGDPRWNKTPTGTSQINLDAKEIKSTEYFDLVGKKTSGNAPGFVIEKVMYTDGSVAVKKIKN